MSVEPRPVGGRRCDNVPSAYREIRCDTFVQNYQFNNPLREENVFVYLRLRFRHLSGWTVVAAATLHEAYLSPRDEYQRHHPPAPSSAGAYWPAVGEVGDSHALPDSSVKRGLRVLTMWMETARSHEP